jgi:hypothetical protein
MSDDVTVTADDLLRSQTSVEIEAARLATQYCTYSRASVCYTMYGVKGVTQSIYSCRTCSSGTSFIGICEPCMLTCHADHDVFELGLRRDFRCDCATQIRGTMHCLVQPKGMPTSGLPVNSNVYLPVKNWSQNKFCTCQRQYDESCDKMIQCAACDDWFHDTCIPGYFDTLGEDSAFICPDCTKKFPYFSRWSTARVGDMSLCTAIGAKDLDVKCSPVESSSCDKTLLPSPDLNQSVTSSEYFFQPWVCCLTCTQGADDGRGVCLVCAELCHAGHILTKPRITQFACDCEELSSKALLHNGLASSSRLSTLSPSNNSSTSCQKKSFAQLIGKKRGRSETGESVKENESISSISTVNARTWCASSLKNIQESEEQSSMVNAAIFADSIDAIVSALCHCPECSTLYAKDRLSSWFHEDERDFVAPDCVQWLLREVLPDTTTTTTTTTTTNINPDSSVSISTSPLPASPSSPSSLVPPPGFSSLHDQGMAALSHLPHMQQQTALMAYTNLTGELMPFLRGFAESGRVVTASDIRMFFQELKRKGGGGDSVL